jgi:HSP20 family protein
MTNFLMKRSPILGPLSKLSFDFDNLMNSFFEDDFFRDEMALSKSFSRLPKINVRDLKDKYAIEAAVPGLNKENIKVSVKGNNVILSYDSKEEVKEDNNGYLMREISQRSFSRLIPFNEKIDKDKIEAKMDNGVLVIEVGKLNSNVEPDVKEIEIR